MKNIALAIQMYLADNNDTLAPGEHRAEVIEFFMTIPGGGEDEYPGWCEENANPYLRYPVILDEYVKNREVWSCPSAKTYGGAVFIVPGPDWFTHVRSYEGAWGAIADYAMEICYYSFPPGWGGDVTDSLGQERYAVPGYAEGEVVKGAFVQSIDVGSHEDMKLVEVQDPVNYVIVVETGPAGSAKAALGTVAYPDICMIMCGNEVCGWADWENCGPDHEYCGIYNIAPNNGSLLRDPELRKPYSRHLGGVNIGYLDGHAGWMLSERVIDRFRDGELGGLYAEPTSDCVNPETGNLFSQDYPGVPTIY